VTPQTQPVREYLLHKHLLASERPQAQPAREFLFRKYFTAKGFMIFCNFVIQSIKLSYLPVKEYLNHKIFDIISEIVDKEHMEAYVIGGYVRDSLLGRPSKDVDIVIVGSGIELARKVAKKIGYQNHLVVFKNFGTAMLNFEGIEIEFVGARKESYRRDSRKPIVEDGTLEDDLNRRDFTINALGIGLHLDLHGKLVDPFNGLDDLKNGKIRTPLDPNTTFSDDPLRMMRAIRFASQLEFTIEDETFNAIHENRERIGIISRERITDEMNKIILSPVPSSGFILLERSGLMEIVFPELHVLKGVEDQNGVRHKDNFYHTIRVLDNISKKSDNLWLRWAALLHDIAKSDTKRFEPGTGWTFHGHEYLGAKKIPDIFRKYKLPLNEKMKYVQKLVLLHLRPIGLSKDDVTDSAIRRLVFDAGDDLEDLMLLCEADITSKNKMTVKRHMHNFKIVRKKIQELEEKDSIRNFQPPISGDIIMDVFGIPPSEPVGIIKNAIKDAILDGMIRNNYDEAYRFMLEKGKELGLEPVKK
jgi:poly(A) polymerase